MVPTFDGGDDSVAVGGPGEGLGLGVVFGDEAVDGGLEVDDRSDRPELHCVGIGELLDRW